MLCEQLQAINAWFCLKFEATFLRLKFEATMQFLQDATILLLIHKLILNSLKQEFAIDSNYPMKVEFAMDCNFHSKSRHLQGIACRCSPCLVAMPYDIA